MTLRSLIHSSQTIHYPDRLVKDLGHLLYSEHYLRFESTVVINPADLSQVGSGHQPQDKNNIEHVNDRLKDTHWFTPRSGIILLL